MTIDTIMNYEEILREYHRRVGEIFLAAGQTPFRICKQLWALHAEFERRLTLVATPMNVKRLAELRAQPVVFHLAFDADPNLSPDEQAEAYHRLARYGQWGNGGYGCWWTPSPSEAQPRERIAREGFVVVEER